MPEAFNTTGPHIHSRDSVSKTMWTIVAAMLPATLAACILFGVGALYPILGTALFCVLFEWPFTRRQPLGDGSAFVAGMILGLSLAPRSPWWIPPLGALILVTLGKQVFGGIGNNIFNPALAARAVLLLSWPRPLATWTVPFDGITGATPLEGAAATHWELFLGTVPGSLGETSALAILLGGAFLVARGLVNWRVPAAVIVGALAAALLFGVDPLFTVLAGSLLFGAVFMATDMVTSPTGKTTHVVFGFGCGFLTVFIRTFTIYPEGVTFAFLIMNGLAYLMDRIGADPIFGQVQQRSRRRMNLAASLGGVCILAVAAGLTTFVRDAAGTRFTGASLARAVRHAFPAADRLVDAPSYDAAVARYRVYADRRLLGYFAEATVNGYGGPMQVHIAQQPDGALAAVRIAAHRESPTVGSRILTRDFLDRFTGLLPDARQALPDTVDTITGATVSSRAVMTAVERALGADLRPPPAGGALPPLADGTYRGSGRGYQGPIEVVVTVQGGRLAAIEAARHSESPGIGTRAIESLIREMLGAQSLDIDAVTGATGTSRGLVGAVSDALPER